MLGRKFIASHDMSIGRLVSPFGPEIKTSFAYYLTCLHEVRNEPVVSRFFDWVMDESAASRSTAPATH